jgi:hypothetical protein
VSATWSWIIIHWRLILFLGPGGGALTQAVGGDGDDLGIRREPVQDLGPHGAGHPSAHLLSVQSAVRQDPEVAVNNGAGGHQQGVPALGDDQVGIHRHADAQPCRVGEPDPHPEAARHRVALGGNRGHLAVEDLPGQGVGMQHRLLAYPHPGG